MSNMLGVNVVIKKVVISDGSSFERDDGWKLTTSIAPYGKAFVKAESGDGTRVIFINMDHVVSIEPDIIPD